MGAPLVLLLEARLQVLLEEHLEAPLLEPLEELLGELLEERLEVRLVLLEAMQLELLQAELCPLIADSQVTLLEADPPPFVRSAGLQAVLLEGAEE